MKTASKRSSWDAPTLKACSYSTPHTLSTVPSGTHETHSSSCGCQFSTRTCRIRWRESLKKRWKYGAGDSLLTTGEMRWGSLWTLSLYGTKEWLMRMIATQEFTSYRPRNSLFLSLALHFRPQPPSADLRSSPLRFYWLRYVRNRIMRRRPEEELMARSVVNKDWHRTSSEGR